MFNKTSVLLLITLLAVFAVMSPALTAGFVNWDDPAMVTENPLVRDAPFSNLKEIFTRPVGGRLYPLTMLTYQLEMAVSDGTPFLFHLDNLFLHVLNTALVFYLLTLLGLPAVAAALSAFLFGVHPIQVEAVAWVSSRDDLLGALFYLLAVIKYIEHDGHPDRRGYAAIFLFFILSLLAKPWAVTLPLLMVLMDVWSEGREALKQLGPKLGMLVISFVWGFIALAVANNVEGFQATAVFPFFERVVLSCFAAAMVLVKLAAPHRLSVITPFPEKEGGLLPPDVLMVAGLTALLFVLLFSRKGGRTLKFAAGAFLILLLPGLHVLKANTSLIYERFVYLPAVAVIPLIVHYLMILWEGRKQAPAAAVAISRVAVVMYLLVIAGLGWARTTVWQDSGTLWTDVIKQYPLNEEAYANRGLYRLKQGDPRAALNDLNTAVLFSPAAGYPRFNRAGVRAQLGDINGALMDYTAAIRLGVADPQSRVDAYKNRGLLFAMQEKWYDAIWDYEDALKLDPDDAQVLFNRALALYKIKRYGLADKDADRVLEIWPDHGLTLELKRRIAVERGEEQAP